MPKRDSHSSSSSPRRRPSSSASSSRSKRRSPAEQQDESAGGGGGAASTSNNASSVEPNFNSSDPYAILGVPRDATFAHIKLSYRKLALKHHPDRQNSETDKKIAHENFAAIGHAYEILGDEGRRREYDEGLLQQQQQQYQQQQYREQGRGHNRGFGQDPFSMFDDPFFSSSFGFGGPRSSSNSGFHFTDPFELFEKFFAEELGHHRRHHSRSMDPFSSDPFFSSGDPFSDPFFSSSRMMMGGRGSMFGGSRGGGMSHMLSSHFDRMDDMMSQMSGGSMLGGFDQQHQQLMGRNNGNGRGGSYNFASSSRSSSNGGGRQSVSTSTRTTIINGVRTTVRERTVVHPDGTVDRHVETIEGDGNEMGRLPSANNNRPALDYGGSRRRSRR